jgi:hypothetical protein
MRRQDEFSSPNIPEGMTARLAAVFFGSHDAGQLL